MAPANKTTGNKAGKAANRRLTTGHQTFQTFKKASINTMSSFQARITTKIFFVIVCLAMTAYSATDRTGDDTRRKRGTCDNKSCPGNKYHLDQDNTFGTCDARTAGVTKKIAWVWVRDGKQYCRKCIRSQKWYKDTREVDPNNKIQKFRINGSNNVTQSMREKEASIQRLLQHSSRGTMVPYDTRHDELKEMMNDGLPDCQTHYLKKDNLILAHYRLSKWDAQSYEKKKSPAPYTGTVLKVNDDNTIDVRFDDGVVQPNLNVDWVVRMQDGSEFKRRIPVEK